MNGYIPSSMSVFVLRLLKDNIGLTLPVLSLSKGKRCALSAQAGCIVVDYSTYMACRTLLQSPLSAKNPS